MAGISVGDVSQCWYSNTEQGQYIVMEASSIALPDKSQCPSPTPNISTQLCRLGPRSALLSRVVCSSLGPSPSFCSNCLNIMCFPINCAPNLSQSGLWAAFGFRLPFARRPQSNYCSRGDTRAPSLARAFSDRFVTRHDWRRRLNRVGSRRARRRDSTRFMSRLWIYRRTWPSIARRCRDEWLPGERTRARVHVHTVQVSVFYSLLTSFRAARL